MSSKNLSTPMDRRKFLRIVGLGVGTLAVTGAGGLTWRAADGGVFATGTGPAYAAWDESGPRSTALWAWCVHEQGSREPGVGTHVLEPSTKHGVSRLPGPLRMQHLDSPWTHRRGPRTRAHDIPQQ